MIAPQVEDERPHDTAAANREFFLDDASILSNGKIVGHDPILGAAFNTPIDVTGVECLNSDRGVAEILELQLI